MRGRMYVTTLMLFLIGTSTMITGLFSVVASNQIQVYLRILLIFFGSAIILLSSYRAHTLAAEDARLARSYLHDLKHHVETPIAISTPRKKTRKKTLKKKPAKKRVKKKRKK